MISATEQALENCGREPIHIPGAIQPHGMLLALEEPSLRVLHASANAGEFCGVDFSGLLGKPLASVAAEAARAISALCAQGDPATLSPLRVVIAGKNYDVLLHRSEGLLFAEFEKASDLSVQNFHRRLQRVFADLRNSESPEALYEKMATFVAHFTGFERVMVYRFEFDWHGEVVGECLTADVDSYQGHHFPASDIPPQARALYSRSWLRIIPDASYTPVAIEPAANARTGGPLDLSQSVLRSVSPIHLEYLRNMDVAASMSISLMVEGKLWGLIACHHRMPRVLCYAERAVCEIFGQVASLEIAAQQERRRLADHVQATTIQARFFDIIAQEHNAVEALVKYTPELLEFMGASGAAIHVNEITTLLGNAPSEKDTGMILDWLKTQPLQPLLVTDSLQKLLPTAEKFRETASGLLAVKLSLVEPQYLLWFRPEVIETVTWAGNPDKPVDEHTKLHPRKSFSAWKETVRGKSRPWKEAERRGAQEVLNALNALLLRRTERLLSLNAELEKKNTDLNSFAYIAAHDLKEPIRGIANYCSFLREDHASDLSPEALRKLDTIDRLAIQSEQLLIALNHFSRIGRMEVAPVETDMDALLDGVIDGLEDLAHREKVKVLRAGKLPVANCDPVLVREIFSNLITNAVRYNDKDEKRIEIGCTTGEGGTVYFVRDNGIGIREKHFDSVFVIFRRLHAQSAYGGGSGAGLAIVKTIVERHGGKIWIESVENEGTTFNFTLGAA
jgi:light-regulated signal transduction histidine kinase (bacteriophytochrome)